MKFETLSHPRFSPLNREHMSLITGRGDTTEGGSEQAGVPVWNEAAECYIVKVRFWSADSIVGGIKCYEDQRYGEIYTPVTILPPGK